MNIAGQPIEDVKGDIVSEEELNHKVEPALPATPEEAPKKRRTRKTTQKLNI